MSRQMVRCIHWRRPIFTALLVLLAGATTGCGWLFVSGPPPTASNNNPYIPCTDSKVLPVLDAVMSGLQVLNILYVSSMDEYDYYDTFQDTPKSTVIALQAGFGTLWGFSAWSGFGKVNDCRAARMAAASGAAADDAAKTSGETEQIQRWHPPMLFPMPVTSAPGNGGR